MSRKNIQNINLSKETKVEKQKKSSAYTTAEGIDLKSSYTKDDIKDIHHLNFSAGIPPYLRGPYSTWPKRVICGI